MSLRRRGLGFSDLLSLVLNPSVMTGVFVCLVAAEFEAPGFPRVLHAALGFVFTSLIPVGLLFVLKDQARLSDIEMSVRSERELVYLLCALGYALGSGLLLITGASWQLWGLLALHVPNTLILMLLNRRLKVSIHTMVITSLWVAALMFFSGKMAPAGILIPAAAWARWKAGSHSIRELLWGMLVGGALTTIEIFALQSAYGI